VDGITLSPQFTKEDIVFNSLRLDHRKTAATMLTTLALSACCVVTGASTANAEPQAAASANRRLLVGSWVETVTFPPESGRPQLKSLVTFHADATMVCSDQGSVTTTGDQPGVFTSCHGVWTHLEKRIFAYTSFELISDLSGNLVGYLKVRGTYKVSASGDTYTGTSFAQIIATDGTVLFEIGVTNAGQRIKIELP
jgi:hypothetical protein